MIQSEIFAAVREYLEVTVDDLSDAVLSLLTQVAEGQISRDLRDHPNQWRSTALVFEATDGVFNRFTLPAGFLAVVEARTPVIGSAPSRLLRQVYSQFDVDANSFVLGANFTGAGSFLVVLESVPEVSITYQSLVSPLTASETNWIAVGHPDVYIYGILQEAAVHARNKDWLPSWAAAYKNKLGELTAQGWNQQFAPARIRNV
jgi:hypothetical protein